MAIFRVEKTRDYTVMSNHHLKNRSLTLKAKGLLAIMLSLPDDWDYTMKGLAAISVEGIDAIRQALGELERHGYVLRGRVRDEKGCLKGTEYVIYEQPQATSAPLPHSAPAQRQADVLPKPAKPALDKPASENPALEIPTLDHPTLAKPALDNPTQLSTNEVNTYPTKEKAGANPNQSNPYPSYQPAIAAQAATHTCPDGIGMGKDEKGCAAAAYRKEIHERISYDVLLQDSHIVKSRLDEMVDIMVEALCATNDTIVIAGLTIPMALVQERFMRVNSQHVLYAFHCLEKNTSRVRNIKKYLMTVLYNAPCTMDGYYAALVNQEYSDIDLTDIDF